MTGWCDAAEFGGLVPAGLVNVVCAGSPLILDQLLHHAEVILITDTSYRIKDWLPIAIVRVSA